MDKLILYSYFQSSAAYRVRVALNFKGLAYDYRGVDLMEQGQYEASYTQVNAMAEVPTLVTGSGASIGQSMAIFHWLDRKYPEPRLFPEEPTQMASVIQFCENINSGIHPVQNLKVRQELEKRYKASTEEREQWCAFWISRGFDSLEKLLKQKSGNYCFGQDITAADMFLVPQVFNARRYKVDMSKYPLISKIDQNCNLIDAFKKAHPSVQPDTPKS